MPGTKRLGALLALLAAIAALSGCGSDEISGEIPADDAPALRAALNGVSTTIETDCDQAQEYAQDFVDAVNQLPEDPTGELKQPLQEAAENLRTLVARCATEPPATTQSTTTTITSTPTETSTTETSTTDTSTTETSTGTTTSTDETPPPGNGNGGGPPGDDGTGGTGSDKGGK